MTKKLNNTYELEAELARLLLRREMLLKDIQKSWRKIKEEGTPGMIAAEAALTAITGKTPNSRVVINAAEMLLRYLKNR